MERTMAPLLRQGTVEVRSIARLRAAATGLMLAAAAGCADAVLDPKPGLQSGVDDRLALTGRVCTDPPEIAAFPVKILFLVDKSGSMSVTDPPGPQQDPNS